MSRMAYLDVLIQQAVSASVQAAKWLLDVQYRTVGPDQVASELTHLARELDGLVAQIRRVSGAPGAAAAPQGSAALRGSSAVGPALPLAEQPTAGGPGVSSPAEMARRAAAIEIAEGNP